MNLFRVRGLYKPTQRESWLTKSWANNREVAQRDIAIHKSHHNWSKLRIVEKNENEFFEEINNKKRKRLPMKHFY